MPATAPRRLAPEELTFPCIRCGDKVTVHPDSDDPTLACDDCDQQPYAAIERAIWNGVTR